MTKFRWNAPVWEFFEPAFGGWTVLRVDPANASAPMTFGEGFQHIVTHQLFQGREDGNGWVYGVLLELGVHAVGEHRD